MALDPTILDKILHIVQRLKDTPEGESFIAKLREILDCEDHQSNSDQVSILSRISQNINEIRKLLNIQANTSIDFSFIPDRYVLLRNKLIVDNLRMEQTALNIQEMADVERFYYFCLYAFYQIENLVNYYYFVKFPNFEDLVQYLQKNSKFTLRDNQTSIADIEISFKLWAFCAENFPKHDSDFSFNLKGNQIQNVLRTIRNQGSHRCQVIFENSKIAEQESLKKIYDFYHRYNIDYVRELVKDVAYIVQKI